MCKLTQQGRQALVHIDQFLASVDDFKANIATINDCLAGKIEIGVVDYAVSDERNPLIHAIEKYREIAPKVTISPTMGTPSEVEHGIIDGRFHIGIVPDYQRLPGLQYVYLYDEIAGLFCGGKHPLARVISRGEPYDEQEVYKHELVHRGFFECENLRLVKQKFPVGTVVNQTEALLALVQSGTYLGFFPVHCTTLMRGQIYEVLPEAFRYTMPICAIFRRNRRQSAVLQEFLDLVLEDQAECQVGLPRTSSP